MAVSLNDLIAQKEALEQQIRGEQSKAKVEAVGRVRQLMAQYGLTIADLNAALRKTGAKVAPKYRDPATGLTWTGRGLKPKWLATALNAGKTLNDFAI